MSAKGIEPVLQQSRRRFASGFLSQHHWAHAECVVVVAAGTLPPKLRVGCGESRLSATRYTCATGGPPRPLSRMFSTHPEHGGLGAESPGVLFGRWRKVPQNITSLLTRHGAHGSLEISLDTVAPSYALGLHTQGVAFSTTMTLNIRL